MVDKEKWVIHIRALKQALNHDLKLIKLHRVITFNQRAQLKTYTDLNTQEKEEKNEFAKDFFKLMNNSVYGKKKQRMLEITEILN